MIIPKIFRTTLFTFCAMIVAMGNARPMGAGGNIPGFTPEESVSILNLAHKISEKPRDWIRHEAIYDALEVIADDDKRDQAVEAMKLLRKQLLQPAPRENFPEERGIHQNLLKALAAAERNIAHYEEAARNIELTAMLVALIFIIKFLLAGFQPCIGCSQDYYFTGQNR